MSDTPENIAAILAEMRGNEFDDPHLDADGIIGARRLARDWADRIDAAAEREREAYCEVIHEKDEAYDRLLLERDKAIKARAPGNAAALSEALWDIADYAAGVYGGEMSDDLRREILRIVRTADSAPARNCDRFANADEARLEFQKVRGHKVWADIELWDDMDEVGAFVRWLFSQTEKGGPK